MRVTDVWPFVTAGERIQPWLGERSRSPGTVNRRVSLAALAKIATERLIDIKSSRVGTIP